MPAWIHSLAFACLKGRFLVYNSCWEDPRLDRAVMQLGPRDRVLTIASAGCNALDYLLDEPARVDAVDINPHQIALLELKRAAIRALDFEEFFQLFGRGRWNGITAAYSCRLRSQLSPFARRFWDRAIHWFASTAPTSFYFRGTAGRLAQMVNWHIDRMASVRDLCSAILDSQTLEEQRYLYLQLKDLFWSQPLRWTLRHGAMLALGGVPLSQRRLLEDMAPGGILPFLDRVLETVFGCLPLADNYFWRVYLNGEYSPECCPEYLKPNNFERLKAGAIERLHLHPVAIADFLRQTDSQFSHFVLLDHMDWLAQEHPRALVSEWQEILAKAAPHARILWRSAGDRTDFVDKLVLSAKGQRLRLGELLSYEQELAADLHRLDRVHTYGSFHIANLEVPG
jgi:S-adenosylmethionine-diacylglycerol 3-amino-3-carboxypropyl transferase